MRKYSSLKIQDTHERLVKMLERLKINSNNKYVYESSLSDDYAANIFLEPSETACFRVVNDSSINPTIWLCVMGKELRVANIVPGNETKLSISEYNYILRDFFSDFVSRMSDDEMVVFIDGNDVKMDTLISKDAFEKLNLWARLCNQDNPISHRFDEERWFDFLIALEKNDDDLEPSDLVKWLQEDLGWPYSYNPERFVEIRDAYEYGLSMLKYINNTEE